MHGLEVVAEQIAQTKLLLRGDILFALQNAPARFLQQRRVALLGHLAGLGNADCIGSRLRWPPLVTKRYTKAGWLEMPYRTFRAISHVIAPAATQIGRASCRERV